MLLKITNYIGTPTLFFFIYQYHRCRAVDKFDCVFKIFFLITYLNMNKNVMESPERI